MWEKIKSFAKKHPNLTSLVSFVLFFFSLAYLLSISQLHLVLDGGKMMVWLMALFISASLAVREYSHVFAMKRLGMKVQAVIFIPFLGAVAIGGERVWKRHEEVIIAAAGPLAGYLTALPFYIIFKATDSPLAFLTMFFIVLINLFNMLPMSPLDGGRIMKSIFMSLQWKWLGFLLWCFGIVFALSVLRNASLILMILLAVLAGQEFVREYGWQRMRKKLLCYIDERWGAEAPTAEMLRGLSDCAKIRGLRDLPDDEFKNLTQNVCRGNIDYQTLDFFDAQGFDLEFMEPMNTKQFLLSVAAYLILFATPILFFI